MLRIVVIGLLAAMWAGGATAAEEEDGEARATVWFLGHSGFALRTANHLLVFDCATDEPAPGGAKGFAAGVVDPEGLRDRSVVFFVSHGHADHFAPDLLRRWRREFGKARFVLPTGLAEREGTLAEELGPALVEVSAGAEFEVDGVAVYPIAATDEGLGYRVSTDGLSLFFAGDHARWSAGCREAYEDGIRDVKERGPLHLAFLPLQPIHPHRDEVLAGAAWAAETLRPAAVVPMHLSGRLEEAEELARLLRERDCDVPCVVPRSRGERFLFDGSTLRTADTDWTALLLSALREDGRILAQVREAGGDRFGDAAFDEGWWGREGSVTEVPLDTSEAALAGPARFFLVHGGVFGMLSRPVTTLTVGLPRSGEAVLIGITTRKWAGVPRLAGFLRPVRSGPEAIAAAALAARLLVYCKTCNRSAAVRVDPAACAVTAGRGGGFGVDIPAAASTSKAGESAKVIFDAAGRLTGVEFEPCRHR